MKRTLWIREREIERWKRDINGAISSDYQCVFDGFPLVLLYIFILFEWENVSSRALIANG